MEFDDENTKHQTNTNNKDDEPAHWKTIRRFHLINPSGSSLSLSGMLTPCRPSLGGTLSHLKNHSPNGILSILFRFLGDKYRKVS